MTERDTDLEHFFAAAKAGAPQPSAAFMARVLAEAEAVQAGIAAAQHARHVPPQEPPRPGIWAVLNGLFGGGLGMGGMATAALAGLWIGFAGAETLTGYWPVVVAADAGTLNLMPGEDLAALLLGEEN